MDRRDAVVAGVGAVLVALAVVGASLGGAAASPWRLVYDVQATTTELQGTGAGSGILFALPVGDNATEVEAEVTFTATGTFAPTATSRVTLRGPNGEMDEREVLGGTSATGFVVRVSVHLGDPPPDATVRAASEAEAGGMLVRNATAGEWTVEATFSSGTPVPQPVRIAATGTVTQWTGRVEAAPAVGGK